MYSGDERRKWHVTREISVTDLIGLTTFCGLLFVAYAQLDKRIAVLEQERLTQSVETQLTNTRVQDSLSELNHKMDRLIEKTYAQHR